MATTKRSWIGEDVDFYWALKRHAKRTGGSSPVDTESPCAARPARRFDKWPIWKTLVWTNPLFIFLIPPTESDSGPAGILTQCR